MWHLAPPIQSDASTIILPLSLALSMSSIHISIENIVLRVNVGAVVSERVAGKGQFITFF